MTPEQSGKIDYYEYYGKVIGPLLTRFRDAATQLSESYGQPQILVRANAQSADGMVLSGTFVLLTREAPDKAFWQVSIGFKNFQDLNDHINWDVPDGQFAPINVPIEVLWYGTTRRGARESVPMAFPSVELVKDTVRWGARRGALIHSSWQKPWPRRLLTTSWFTRLLGRPRRQGRHSADGGRKSLHA